MLSIHFYKSVYGLGFLKIKVAEMRLPGHVFPGGYLVTGTGLWKAGISRSIKVEEDRCTGWNTAVIFQGYRGKVSRKLP